MTLHFFSLFFTINLEHSPLNDWTSKIFLAYTQNHKNNVVDYHQPKRQTGKAPCAFARHVQQNWIHLPVQVQWVDVLGCSDHFHLRDRLAQQWKWEKCNY